MKQSPNIQNELKELGISLSAEKGFDEGALQNYFEHFAPNLMERIQLEDVLDKLPKETPYLVPEAYFENFSIQVNKPKAGLLKVSKNNIAKLAGIAAVACVLLLGVGYLYKQTTNKKPETLAHIEPANESSNNKSAVAATGHSISVESDVHMAVESDLASVSAKEAKEYVQKNIEDFESEQLLASSEPNAHPPINEAQSDDINPDEIKQFLLEESLDEIL